MFSVRTNPKTVSGEQTSIDTSLERVHLSTDNEAFHPGLLKPGLLFLLRYGKVARTRRSGEG